MNGLLAEAVKLENDGREFYLESARRTGSELVRALFLNLAADEEAHARWLEELSKADDEVVGRVPIEDRVKEMFERLVVDRDGGRDLPAAALELAIKMEREAIALYQDLKDDTGSDARKKLLEMILDQEWEHLVALKNVHHYLTRPGEWFDETDSTRWNWMNT